MMNPDDTNPLRRIPTRHVPTPATDVGSVLLQARTRKGHSIEVVVQHTRIAKKYIEAMENNRFDEFPALAYLRSFFKSYCEYLDVEFEPLWTKAFPPPPEGEAPKDAPGRTEDAKDRRHEEGPTLGGPALATLAAAAALGLLLFVWVRRADRAQPAPEPQPLAPAALQPVYSPPEPHLNIEFKGESWLRLRVDGDTKFEGRVPKGTRQDWKAKKTLSLRVSDPAALTLMLNGTSYALPAPDAAGDFNIESP